MQQCSLSLENANHDNLENALKAEGYQVNRNGKTLTFQKGKVSGHYDGKKLNFTGTDKVDSDSIKRQYSKQVVEGKAKEYRKKGWQVYREGKEYVFKAPRQVQIGAR